MTRQWQVSLDIHTLEPITAEHLDGLLNALHADGAAVSALEQSLGITLTVDQQTNPISAAGHAYTRVEAAMTAVGLHIEEAVAVETLTEEEADRRLAEPTIPELVGAVEAAEILKVSRQRVHQLASENRNFPVAVVTTATASLWTRASIEAFDRSWTRKPGRPAKEKQGAGTLVDLTGGIEGRAGLYACTACGQELVAIDARHLPPCPTCEGGNWTVLEEPATTSGAESAAGA